MCYQYDFTMYSYLLTCEKSRRYSSAFGVGFAKNAFAFQIRQVITTIPGIGETLGDIIVSAIGDIHRFDAPNKLRAFARLDVKDTQSGDFTGTKQHISKQGSPYLRRAIWLAANRAAFCDPTLSGYYQSLKFKGKHHLTAVGVVSRKMCNIIFTILRGNRPYELTPPKKSNRE